MCIKCLLNILAENIQKLIVLTEIVSTKFTDIKDNRRFSIMTPFLGLSIMWQCQGFRETWLSPSCYSLDRSVHII